MNLANQYPSAVNTTPPSDLSYRSDIDGLRGLAVLFVVIYHAFPEWLRGGFIGVDVFFVISGFIITRIIHHELANQTFRITNFFAKRIRRIFPALLAVLIACGFLGWFALLPDEYAQLGKHMAGGSGFVSNLVFWRESGYFDTEAELKPLLHLWSLAIEEQYYIIWPLLMLAIWRRKRTFLVVTLVIMLLSFSWNIALRETDPVQAFFSPVTRIWELLAGSILGYVSASMPKPALQLTARANSKHSPYPLNWMRHLLSLAGFGLLFAGVLLIDQGRSFPGWWALIPVVGSWTIIASGPSAWFNHRVLSLPWLVFVGHISYPLYLWHWPLLSFLKITETGTAPVWMRAAAVMVALLLAWATCRWLETPIRRRPVDRVTTTLLVLGIALSGLSGFAIYRLGGLEGRASVQQQLALAEEMKFQSHWVGWQRCGEGDVVACRLLNPDRPPEVALVGDSHAAHLASGIAHYLRGSQTPVLARVRAGCFPMYDRFAPGMEDFACRHALMNGILDEVIAMPSIHTVLLSGYGVLRINGDRGVPPTGAPDGVFHNSQTDEFIRARAERFGRALDYTLDKLQASGKRVVFVIDVPELNFNPRQCTQMRPLSIQAGKQKTTCEVSRTDADKRSRYYIQAVADARLKHPQVRFIDSWEAFCNDRACSAQQEGRLLYSSRDHLSPTGSRHLMDRLGHEVFP